MNVAASPHRFDERRERGVSAEASGGELTGVEHRDEAPTVPDFALQRVLLELARHLNGLGVILRLDPFGKVEISLTLHAVKLVARHRRPRAESHYIARNFQCSLRFQ